MPCFCFATVGFGIWWCEWGGQLDSGSSTTVVELQKQYKMYHGYKMSKMYGETILKDSLYLF